MSALRSVTFLDSRIGDTAAVLAALPVGEQVFVIDGAQDGLDQITALLAGTGQVDALHIISHGSDGVLLLGNGTVDAAALTRHADDLAAIGQHLAPGGDILLYGCNVAAGDAGQAFVQALAALTHADVAASTDLTGAAALGGNWTLEARTGAIEAHALALAGFQGVLDTINGDGNANVLAGTEGDDTISGFGGNDTITGLGGNDTIDGGTGADSMSGGLGNDTYYIDSASDQVIEAPGEGADLVYSSVSIALSNNVENLTLLGTGAINGVGNVLDNVLIGNSGTNLLNGGSGDDWLDGQGGNDTLIGGQGDDTYSLDRTGDTIVENELEGIDTVRATFSYALGKGLENLMLLGQNDLSGNGNSLNNIITGNDGNNILTGEDGNDTLTGGAGTDTLIGGNGGDVLDGGTGLDTMTGGIGNDTYYVDNPGDVTVELVNQGNDTIIASYTYALADNYENLTLSGSAAIDGTGNGGDNDLVGNAGANTLTGLDGNDSLDGGLGNDTLAGGAGDDLYVVDSSGDVVTELAGEGTDTVQSSVTYVLDDTVENLTLTGTDAINATGNGTANVLVGNDGANTIWGLQGNDTLDGGKGADTLIGGAGDDTYIVDNAGDITSEADGFGTDTVRASVSTTLAANVEALVLTDKASINGTGNDLANTITGNSGDNVIDGGIGADTMIGGDGADTYYVDNAGDVVVETTLGVGVDTVIASVSYKITGFTDNLTLAGSDDLSATGNAVQNAILGNAGRNVIDGGGGVDKLNGGEGGDIYYTLLSVDQFGGEIRDSGTSGVDELRVAYSVAGGQASLNADDSGVEKVVIGTGTGAVADSSGTAAISVFAAKYGSALTIIGNAGGNRIIGTAFADVIDGAAGVDSMTGGLGDDTYAVDNVKDRVVERVGGGVDTVNSTVSYKLGSAVETLNLLGSDDLAGIGGGDDNTLNGNSGNNLLDGGKGNDVLKGFGGNDTLTGGGGSDTLEGGSGADIFRFAGVVKASDGFDTIVDFNSAEGDIIALGKRGFHALGKTYGVINIEQFWSGAGVDTAHDQNDRMIYNTATGNLWFDADGTGTIAPVLIAQLGVSTHPALAYTDIIFFA